MDIKVISNPRGYIAGIGTESPATSPKILPPNIKSKTTKRRVKDLYFINDDKPSTDAPKEESNLRRSRDSNAVLSLIDSAKSFKGLLNSAPDLDLKGMGSSLLKAANTSVAGLSAVIKTGGGGTIGALLNLTSSTTNPAAVLAEQVSGLKKPSLKNLADIAPNVRIPGMPGATTNTDPSVQEFLNSTSNQLSVASQALEIELTLTADQLKKKAQEEFGKINALTTKGKNTVGGALSGIVSRVQAAGGAASSAITPAVAAARVGGAALKNLISNSATGALSGLMNAASETVSIQAVTVDLSGIAPGVLSSATAQTASLVKSLPLPEDALSQLSPAELLSFKERLAFESLSGSGLITNTGAPVSGSLDAMLVKYQGLSTSIKI